MARARNIVHVGGIIRDAVVFDFKNLRGGALDADRLIGAVERLFTVLHEREVDYLLVGGVAMLLYVEGRNTQDVALILAVSDLEQLPELQIESQDADFARARFETLRVDVLLTNNPLFEKVRSRYATVGAFVERNIPCATVEGLIILKLYALPSLYRQGNFARVGLYENDVATLVQAYRPSMESLLDELADQLNPADLAAVRDIVAEISRRIERFQGGTETGA